MDNEIDKIDNEIDKIDKINEMNSIVDSKNIDNINIKLEKIKEILSKENSNLDKYKQLSAILFEKIGRKILVQQWQIDWMNDMRMQEKSYEDISKILGISISSVRYHLVPGEKEKMIKANLKNRERMKANPSAWSAYKQYQKEYQRQLKKEKKMFEEPHHLLEPHLLENPVADAKSESSEEKTEKTAQEIINEVPQ